MDDPSKNKHLVLSIINPVSEKYEFESCVNVAKKQAKAVAFKTEDDMTFFMITAKNLSEILENQNDIDGVKEYIKVMSEIMNVEEESENQQ